MRAIYFTDKTKGTIEIYNLVSGTRRVVYSSLSQPSAFSYIYNQNGR